MLMPLLPELEGVGLGVAGWDCYTPKSIENPTAALVERSQYAKPSIEIDVSDTGDGLRSVVNTYEVLERFTVRILELGLDLHFAIGQLDLKTDAFGKTDLGLKG